jgi:hypothetical protein
VVLAIAHAKRRIHAKRNALLRRAPTFALGTRDERFVAA